MRKHYDLIVIGCGYNGLALANLLDNSGLRILIVERNSLANAFNSTLDNRGLALSRSSCELLSKININPNIFETQAEILQVQVSAQHQFGCVKLIDKDSLGYVVDSTNLGRALIKKFAQVEIIENISDISLQYMVDNQQWHVNLHDQLYACDLLIGADGINSIVRKKLNIDSTQLFVDNGAMVCNVQIAHNHAGIAYQRFADQQVLALLPFGPKRLKCIITFPNYLRGCLEVNDSQYIAMVQSLIGERVKIVGVSARIYYPALQAQAKQVVAPNTILIGNAANTLSPIAAQGLNLGLRDVSALVGLLAIYGMNIAQVVHLYALQRADDHSQTASFTKYIHKLMIDNPCKISPGLLLGALELQPWCKQRLLSQALGVNYLS
jgi:2-octaprenyl-6-methoxyphenol hydroxylase